MGEPEQARAGAPLGVFDSGVGGLSVLEDVRRALPHEDILYLADTANCPYGQRPNREIGALAEAGAAWLRGQGAKALVVACNTASVALPQVRAWAGADWPVVGLVPAVKPAVERTRTGRVVVLATEATLRGALLADVIARFALPAGVEVLKAADGRLVTAVEAGAVDTTETRAILARALDPALAAGADVLVLGCTHYPFLRPALHALYGDRLLILDSGAAVARRAAAVLGERGLLHPGPAPGGLQVYTTGDPATVGPVVANLLHQATPVLHADVPILLPIG